MGQDNIINTVPDRRIRPDDPNLLLGFDFADGDLSTWSRYPNKAVLGGAAYDLVTRAGTPLIGYSGGLYAFDSATAYWQGPAGAAVDLSMEACWPLAPTAARVPVWNGTNAGTGHVISTVAGGFVIASMNGFGVSSTTAYSVIGRGPFRADVWHDGALQRLLVNGRLADSDAVAPGVPAGFLRAGYHGEILKIKARTVSLGSDATYREQYIREFAKRVVYHWQPVSVGEGPAGGIPSGAVGEGDWYCASGGASLAFVWRPNLSLPAGGQLALTDSGALSARRLAFQHGKAPAFGSWLYVYQIRTTATDNPIFGITPLRDSDPTAAAAGSYRAQGISTGAVWRTTLHRDNGAALITVDHPLPVAGDTLAILHTRHPSGDHRLFAALNWTWYGNESTVANDVTYLSTNFVHVEPRGSYVLGHVRYQGEVVPGELFV